MTQHTTTYVSRPNRCGGAITRFGAPRYCDNAPDDAVMKNGEHRETIVGGTGLCYTCRVTEFERVERRRQEQQPEEREGRRRGSY